MARKKILLVDDSGTILMMEKMLLTGEECDLVTAMDGQEAFDKALAERPDLIVMDVVMPKLTGFEVCERLRAHQDTKATPILLVTTRGEAENIERGFASGCNGYITKPIDRGEFLAKVRDHLAG
jgi:CheY-like chemotaxis protein